MAEIVFNIDVDNDSDNEINNENYITTDSDDSKRADDIEKLW